MKKNKPRQLSFLTPERFSDALKKFVGRRGWTLLFKESVDGQLMAVTGSLQEVYDALADFSAKCPHYYSAIIYRPTGAKHRTIR
jgi:hypothetical protein